MPLTSREKMILLISEAIRTYAEKMDENSLSNQSMVDFVLKSIPEDLKSEIIN